MNYDTQKSTDEIIIKVLAAVVNAFYSFLSIFNINIVIKNMQEELK